MSTVAVLPIKSFSQGKRRLAPELTEGPRRVLAEAMFSDVLTALRRAGEVDRIIVVTTDTTAERIAGGHGAGIVNDSGAGHSEAAMLGVAQALDEGADRVILVPGDCPMLSPTELDELLAAPAPAPGVAARSDREAVVVPDRHGSGTNALVLTPPDALTPAFGPDSCERHVRLAGEQGATPRVVEVPTLALDVDTPDDLVTLQATLASTRGGAAHTRGMLNQLMRSRG